MAERRAVATGNWSALATWDGGASLPGAGDTVHANGFTVTIDQNITVISLNTIAGAVAVAGGGFTVSVGGRTINANIVAGSTDCLVLTHTSGTTTVNGNTTGSAATANADGILVSGVGANLTLVGNVTGGGASTAYGIQFSSGAALHVTGVIAGGGGATAIGIRVNTINGATITVVGSILGGSISTARGFFNDTTLASFTQSGGSITGAAGIAVDFAAAVTLLSITGNVTGSATATTGTALSLGAAAIAGTITGTVAGGATANGAPAISDVRTSGVLTVVGPVNGTRASAINKTGNATLIINGDVTSVSAVTNTQYALTETSVAGVLVINGHIYSNSGTALNITGSGTYTVNGNVYNNATITNCYGILQNGGAGFLTVNGDVFANTNTSLANCPGVYSASTGGCTITGQAVAGGGAASNGFTMQAAGTFLLGKAVANDYPNGGNLQPVHGALCGSALYACTIKAMKFGSGGANPLGPLGKWFIDDAAVNSVEMRQSNAGAITTMGDVPADYAAVGNVRAGVVYAFGARVGTLAVPPPASVGFGVPTDNTTGTAAVLSQAEVAAVVGPIVAGAGW